MKKVTYQQIADTLQISRVTVWKALNNRPGISPATRQAILIKAVEMGYPISLLKSDDDAPQTAAMPTPPKRPSMLPSSPINVAVVVSRPETSNFWMSIIHYQAMTFAQNEINLIYTYLPPTSKDTDSLPECLTNGTIQGIIVMNIYDTHQIEALNQLPIQKVFLDIPSQTEFSSLNGDLFLLEGLSSVDEIVQRMIDKGKRRIHFIGDIAYAQTNRERHLGYLRAMQRNEIPTDNIVNLTTPIEIESYHETIFSYLNSLDTLPEAIVCANDHIAYHVVIYCREHGIRVPEDIMISGYDDNYEFNTLVPLTTVHVSNARLGMRLANRLINRLQYPEDDFEFTYIRNKPLFRKSTGD